MSLTLLGAGPSAGGALGIVTEGLVLNLDAGNTSSYPGNGTDWFDLSTKSNDSTLYNGATFSSDNGGCIVLDGTNDLVDFNVPSSEVSMPITFDFWINSDVNNPVGIYDTAPGQVNVLRNYPAGHVEWWPSSPKIALGLSASVWYNLTIIYSFNTNRKIQYYKNSVFVSSAIGNTTAAFAWGQNPVDATISGAPSFGKINSGGDGRFGGRYAVIKIYNRALSADEIDQNYNAIKSRFGL
jgi:hypothetical protein